METVLTRMWEARVRAGMLDPGIRWVFETVVPAARENGATSVEVCYASEPTPRIVVISRWPTDTGWCEPSDDPELIARSHGWSFRPLDDPSTIPHE